MGRAVCIVRYRDLIAVRIKYILKYCPPRIPLLEVSCMNLTGSVFYTQIEKCSEL